jgi:hypothetical protein
VSAVQLITIAVRAHQDLMVIMELITDGIAMVQVVAQAHGALKLNP